MLGAGALAPPDAQGKRPPLPALLQTPYLQQIDATLAPATRAALVQANSPREWNLLFLSSPEFMHG